MKILKDTFEQLNIPYSENQIEKFRAYMEGILSWNEKINLTAIREKDEFLIKHFADSVICFEYEEYQKAETIIDVGTGAGFPGVPLAILSPDKEFILMDSLNKRLKVIDSLCSEIGINNVTTVHARAEDLARNKEYREKYDLCVSRAVANMAVLAEYCLPFIKTGGRLIAYKGPELEKELSEAQNALKILGGRVNRIEGMNLPSVNLEHKILVVEKFKATPSKYPRKSGTPVKEPLK